MKLRKILTSTIAVTACVAMLSTNVLAAVEIQPGADGNKLTVDITGTTGQTTFLALDADTVLANAGGDDIQYIDQDDAASLDIAFAKRADTQTKTYSKTVDLYVGGENVTDYALVEGVYVEADAAVVAASYTHTCTEANDEFATMDLGEYFTANALKVNYAAIGSTAAAEVTYSAANASDFELTRSTTDNATYTIAVKYKGIAAGNVTVAETDLSPVASIAITGVPTETIYVDDAAAFDAAAAKAALANATVTATHKNDATSTVNKDNLTYSVTDGENNTKVITITYAEGITTTATLTVITKAIESGAVVGGTTATLTVRDASTVDEAAAIEAVKDAGIKVTYTWNDGATSDASDLTYAAEKAGEAWEVTITSPKVTLTGNVITVTVVESSATGIKGKVTVADTWGAKSGTTFTNAIPVGAVVTAIPVTTTNNSYSGNVAGVDSLGYTAKSAIVDENGNYELELEPGTYNVFVAHTRFEVLRRNASLTNISVYRTVLDGSAKQMGVVISDTDADLVTHNVELRYAYAGDMNLDGSLNPNDFNLFKANYNSTVPAIQ